jgi:flagellar biosynthesis/type III secretory pathway chaperone
MSTLETHLLAELIGRKHDCLAELLELGRQQTAIVSDGEISQLMVLLAAKQRLIDQLREVEGELDPFRSQQPHQRIWASVQARDRCAEMLNRCDEMFREIMAREKQSENRLIERRDEVAQRLVGTNASAHARAAYLADMPPSASCLDFTAES